MPRAILKDGCRWRPGHWRIRGCGAGEAERDILADSGGDRHQQRTRCRVRPEPGAWSRTCMPPDGAVCADGGEHPQRGPGSHRHAAAAIPAAGARWSQGGDASWIPMMRMPSHTWTGLGLQGWCGRGDSNPHASRRQNLNLVRLPIPPLPRGAILSRRRREAAIRQRTTAVPPAGWRVPRNAGRTRGDLETSARAKQNARQAGRLGLHGGPSRIRTLDLLIKSQLLYQLS